MSDKLSPFSSKAKELARNFSMVSESLVSSGQVLAQLNALMTDLIILADELELEDGEIENIASIVQDGMEKVQELQGTIVETDSDIQKCVIDLMGPSGIQPYMDREIVNPYDPVFTYKEGNMIDIHLVKKVAARYYSKHSSIKVNAAKNKLDKFIDRYRAGIMTKMEGLVDGWGKGDINDRHPLKNKLDTDHIIQVTMPRHDDTTFAFGLGQATGSMDNPKLMCYIVATGPEKDFQGSREVTLGVESYTLSEISGFIQDVLVKELGVKVNVF